MPNFLSFFNCKPNRNEKEIRPRSLYSLFRLLRLLCLSFYLKSLPKKWNVTRSWSRLSTHIKCAAVVSRVFNTTTTGTTSLIHYHSPAFGFFHDLKTSTIDTVFSSLLHFHSPQYFFSLTFVAFLFILLSKATNFLMSSISGKDFSLRFGQLENVEAVYPWIVARGILFPLETRQDCIFDRTVSYHY